MKKTLLITTFGMLLCSSAAYADLCPAASLAKKITPKPEFSSSWVVRGPLYTCSKDREDCSWRPVEK